MATTATALSIAVMRFIVINAPAKKSGRHERRPDSGRSNVTPYSKRNASMGSRPAAFRAG